MNVAIYVQLQGDAPRPVIDKIVYELGDDTPSIFRVTQIQGVIDKIRYNYDDIEEIIIKVVK
jgi:hypothetical protein